MSQINLLREIRDCRCLYACAIEGRGDGMEKWVRWVGGRGKGGGGGGGML